MLISHKGFNFLLILSKSLLSFFLCNLVESYVQCIKKNVLTYLDLKNLKPIEHEVEELEHPLCYVDAVLDSNDQNYEFDTAERHGALDSIHCIISHVNLRAAGRRMSKGRAIELKDYSCEEYERIVKIAEEKLAGKQREARLEQECSRYCGS